MYKDLSLKEKAKIIREGVRLGINSIDDIQSLYDEAIGSRVIQDNNGYYAHSRFNKDGTTNDMLIKGDSTGTNITTQDIPFKIAAWDNLGNYQELEPDGEYYFPGSMVREHALQLGGNTKPTFDQWYPTVPKQKNDTSSYDLRRAYNTLPFDEMEKFRTINDYHLPSVAYDEKTDTYTFLKRNGHPTLKYELDWYNSGTPDAQEFRERYKLDTLSQPWRYIPITYQNGGGLYQERIKPIEEYITPIEPPVQDNTYVVRDYPHYLLPEIQDRNKRLSDEEISNHYASDILWIMENPNHKGLNPDGTYSAYEDEAGFNFGPGLHAKSNNLDINKTYTKQELDSIASNVALNYMKQISEDLETMQNGKYAGARDTLSAGPLLTMLDIAYNVKPKDKGNMPQKWPNLTDSLINGDIERAKENTYSGSTRRQKMRNQMIVYKPLKGVTVHNEALGGNLFKKGGIYIKPENRGKFTALKKRTGHSTSWFKAHGTPAQKKMATFALNSRHWKHDNGGHLFQEDGQIFKRPQDDLTGRNILTSPILPPKSYYEQFTVPELEPNKPQPLQPLEGTYGNKYSELVPMSGGTYVNNPINKGLQQDWRTHALEFTPLLAIGAGPAMGSTTAWLASKPALYNLGRMTIGSEIGGRSVDLASKAFTGNTWGQNVGNVVEGITGWNPNNTMVGQFVTDLTNPGYAGKEGLAGLAGLFTRFGKRKPNIPQNNYSFTSDQNPFKYTDNNDTYNRIKQIQKDAKINYILTGEEPSASIKSFFFELPKEGVDFYKTPITTQTKEVFDNQVFPRLFKDPNRVEDFELLYGSDYGIEQAKKQMMKDVYAQKQYMVKPKLYEALETQKGSTVGVNYENKGVLIKDIPDNLSYAEGHELRHTTQSVIPRTENEEKILSSAYNDVPNPYKHDYDMSKEWETMNFDARKAVLGEVHGKSSVETQNKIIEKMSDAQIVDRVYKSDGYWRHYIDDLIDKSGIDGPREFVLEEILKTPEFQQKIKLWKNAMMKVGAVSGVIAGVSNNKNKK